MKWLVKLWEIINNIFKPKPKPEPWKPEPFVNPTTSDNQPGTKTQEFSWTIQKDVSIHGHTGDRAKIHCPTYFVTDACGRKDNSSMTILSSQGKELAKLECYQIDTGDGNGSLRLKFELWYREDGKEPIVLTEPIYVCLHISGKLVMRVKLDKPYQSISGLLSRFKSE